MLLDFFQVGMLGPDFNFGIGCDVWFGSLDCMWSFCCRVLGIVLVRGVGPLDGLLWW
jgi:hypothetical protein